MSKIFPKAANALPKQLVIFLFILAGVATAAVNYYATPKYLRVGYEPIQPVPFDHRLHAGQLGLDCRYCHASVEQSATSSVPAAQTCMNCHSIIKPDSPLLQPVRESFASGDPVPWVKVHQAPDYVYFNHSVHVARGVSCVECHGKVNEMATIRHDKPHSMGFCLDCHRAPENFLRAPAQVYDLNSPRLSEAGQLEQAKGFVHDWKVKPPQSCTGCHR